jgi:hypothetical protein
MITYYGGPKQDVTASTISNFPHGLQWARKASIAAGHYPHTALRAPHSIRR